MTDRPAEHGVAAFQTADKAVRIAENACAILAGVILLFMMVIVSLDAIFRYAFQAPIAWQYTLTEDYLMVAVVALSLSWGFRTGGFIRISGFAGAVPPMVRVVIYRAGLVLSFLYVLALAWTGGKTFLRVWTSGEVKIGVIDWPVYLSWVWVPIGCGLLAIRVLLMSVAPSSELLVDPHADDEI